MRRSTSRSRPTNFVAAADGCPAPAARRIAANRRALALEGDRIDALDRHHIAHDAARLSSHQDVADRRGRLQARRNVHRIADDVVAVVRNHHLTGVDSDAQPDLRTEVPTQLGPEHREALLHRGTGANGSKRVVLAQDGDAEDGHEPVPGELHDVPVLRVNGVGEQAVDTTHHPTRGLGVEPLLKGRRARQIGEEDRHDFACRGGRRRGNGSDWQPAGLAEPGSVHELGAAGGAGEHEIRATPPAEGAPRGCSTRTCHTS